MADMTQQVLRPSAAVLRTQEYHPPLGGRDGLRLDFNENTFACSPRVLEVLGRISRSELTRYPERGPVEEQVAGSLGLEAGQVMLTNGVDEAIHVLCQTFLDAGDELLLPVPTYTMYEVYASQTEAEVVRVPAIKDFGFPVDALLAGITPRTKLIAIANPNSPTGNIATRAQLKQILNRAPHAVVLVDEAYFHFFGETVMDWVGMAPNLVVARTFSKAYGLASLRIGALAASSELMQWMRRMISPYSVNAVALACLPAALQDADYLEWYVREVTAARAELAAALDEMAMRHWPSQANFVLTEVGLTHRKFTHLLRERGVLVRDRSADPGCNGMVRITVGTREQMRAGIDAIREVLCQLRAE